MKKESVEKVWPCLEVGGAKVISVGPHVYAAFTMTTCRTRTLVKIGVSQIVASRILQLSTACPYRIQRVLLSHAIPTGAAHRVERAIHKRLAKYHTAGEWFEFEIANPEHKAAFHAETRAAFYQNSIFHTKWQEMDMRTVSRAALPRVGRRNTGS